MDPNVKNSANLKMIALAVGLAVLNRKLGLSAKVGRLLLRTNEADGVPVVVRNSRQIAALLVVASVVLVQTSKNSENDQEEKEWVERELGKRKDRLKGVLEFARESIEQEEEVDVDVILEATSGVATVDRNDPMVKVGLITSAQGVSQNILKMGDLGRKLDSEEATVLLRQLDLEKEILSNAETWLIDQTPLKKALKNATDKAKYAIRVRKSNQLSKALALLERASSQFPFLVASGSLSILYGSINALKTHYKGRIMALAFEELTSMGKKQASSVKKETITGTAKTIFSLEVLGLLSGFVSSKLARMGRQGFIVKLKTDLFRSLITQDIAYFEQHDMHEARGIIGNANYVCMSLFDLPIDTIQNLSSLVASVSMMLSKSSNLSMVLGILLPLRLVTHEILNYVQNILESRMSSPNAADLRDIWSVLVNPVGVRTLRNYGREPIETAIFAQGIKSRDRALENGALSYNLFEIFGGLVDESVDIIGMWYGGELARRGLFQVSDIATFNSTASDAFDKGRMIYYQFKNLLSNNGILDSAEKMYDLLHAVPTIGIDNPPISSMPKSDDEVEWSITFENIGFAYPTRPHVKVIQDVSFSINQGERIGILGESGCGKSTLTSLITRLYDPIDGQISIGGRSIKEYNPLWLRRRIAVVSQSIYLPFRTVKENLLYGIFRDGKQVTANNEQLERDMKRALRLARCEELFMDRKRFPQEWYTDIGRDGSSLSGGERQRLCIAAAVLTKPRILILDEATSAIDEENQFQIQEAIQDLYTSQNEQLTIITIAHRLSNFRYVDKLIVLERGKVIEQGTTSELVSKENGVFRNYVDRSTLNFVKNE